ncbi:TnsD family transposase [Neobacillus niacini]|uniref:TnsD family transposase n=1 Tax=Neobacillus niacini TaxID=86668 RepID=UPI002859AAC8|nr:TnsD family transposase [Neobacillus niacini]MDR7002822.1 hypothetical protein [Neobacillus niacini]
MILFPFLYEDELLYSILARYHLYSGNENTKTTMNDLYGSETICASTILPTSLKLICERLPTPNAYTSEYLINRHTLLPYYAPFIPKERYLELMEIMSESNGKSLFMKLGKTASTVKSPDFLRYCLQCVEEEKVANEESYWHRVHQVEGVMICPKHSSILKESNVMYSERKNKHEFISIKKSVHENDSDVCREHHSFFEHLKFISDQTFYLLNNNIYPFGLENLKNFYIIRLKQEGLVSVSGRIKWVDLIPKFNEFYGVTLLKKLNCYISKDEEDTWLHKMLRKPRGSAHPLRHILLLSFLGETVSSLKDKISNTTFEPFGSGPWPCLNKAADHYKRSVITKCFITRDYKTSNPVGTFSCECGFEYSRRGPDLYENDRYKIGRIKSFGSVWEQKLQELSKQELSLRSKAIILGVDPMTVKRKLSANEQSNEDIKQDTCTQGYRREWTDLIENNKKTITEIRSINPKLYMWLYRNDKEWLLKHYPLVTKSKKTFNLRIDWEKRDEIISMQVETVIKEIIEADELKRVTKNEIGRRIKDLSLASLYKNIDKLPRTKKLLDLYVESIEQFQIRRIKHIVLNMKKTSVYIKEWEVVRQAGLKKKDVEKLNNIIKQVIEDVPK